MISLTFFSSTASHSSNLTVDVVHVSLMLTVSSFCHDRSQIATAATPATVEQSRVKMTACPAVPAVKKSLAAERIEARKVRVAKKMWWAPALSK